MPLDNADEYLSPSAQILLGADRLLPTPKNWIKGKLFDGAGGLCLAGAIAAVVSRGSYSQDAWQAACSAVTLATGHSSIASYNDAPETTFSDIKALLQKAIELESTKVAA